MRGRTSYPGATRKSRLYDNLMVIRFADDGRVAAFTDWWIVPAEGG